MLSNIKEKLLRSVPIFNHEEKPPPQREKCLNPYAGVEVLSKYESEWETLHKNNVNNAATATKLADDIQTICDKIVHDQNNISTIVQILNANIKQSTSNCLTQIRTLYETCELVEEQLLDLEDVIEQVEFQNQKKMHRFHLNQYEIRKLETFQQFKDTLEDKYQKSVEKQETDKKKQLEERQKVFQEAFKSDLEVYKNLGTIPKINVPKSSALLEEIQIEYDQNELDKFFEESK